ncbi:MAG: DNA helicase-2/ATP-dependent DNA helicase PcrA [Pseudohongiellaceae bacterium]
MTSTDPLLADLNPAQREAVEHGDGPLLIVAGAGSGKTRVITRRIARLIRNGVKPWEILAITFTNKAAGEMRGRVEALVGEGQVSLATFHAFCARILRIDGEHVGLTRGYTIYDSNDQISLMKDLSIELGIDTQAFRPRALLSGVSKLKNDGILADEAAAGAQSAYEQVVGRVYGRYTEALAESNAVDFDDLLLKTVDLFRDHKAVLQRYQERYRYVLVDEYQDTNMIQYRIARDVASLHGNMCATGDPDQSIYRWRGARVQNILDFESDFPGAHVVRLEQNYRSTNHILQAASAVISHNTGRLLGGLWSELGDGNQLTVIAADDEESEVDAVVREVQRLLREEDDLSLSDVAIFYRTNALSRSLERALRLHNLAYEIVGALEFYERKEVKDLLAYLKVLANPQDTVSFLRIINVPTRGIGKTSIERLRSWALPQGMGPREAARRAAECPSLTAKPRKALIAFSALLDELSKDLETLEPEALLRNIMDATAFEAYLRDFGGSDGIDRVENVEELAGALAAYSRSAAKPTVTGFLEETALVADVDRYERAPDRLTLMTLHAAKGLEYPAVFIVGMEEGVLPHQRCLENDEDLQEERRLCYVGMTRAQRYLTLSRAGRRMLHGQWMPSAPSRFLAELPADNIRWDDRTGSKGAFGPAWGEGGWGRRHGPKAEAWEVSESSASESADFVPEADDYLDFQIPRRGQAVRHAHFGPGVVTNISGSGASARITVRFQRCGEKQLMAEYARLEPA